jgi:protein dithiol oxidoreductase (disulfide-forming)
MSRFFNPTVMSTLFAVLASSFIAVSASAQQSREVTPIDPPVLTPNDGTIEVLEFFSYGCIHCANLEPALEEWKKKLPADVKFRPVPSGLNLMGVDEISLYHTLEAMGQIERLNKKIFEALHNERVMLGSRPILNKWLEKNGVNPAQFETVEKSFSVVSKVMRGRGLMSQYKVGSTPVITVNGRNQVVQVAGAAAMFATVDRLIAEARAGNTKSSLPAAAAVAGGVVAAGVVTKAATAKKTPAKTPPKAASIKADPAAPSPTPSPSK